MDIFSLQGKVAALSGASTGIGRHMAGTLAAAGAKVVLGARTVAKLDERVAEIRAAGGEAYAAPLDVSDLHSVTAFFDAAEKHFGPVDILVNNAGIEAGAHTFVTLDDDGWDTRDRYESERRLVDDARTDPPRRRAQTVRRRRGEHQFDHERTHDQRHLSVRGIESRRESGDARDGARRRQIQRPRRTRSRPDTSTRTSAKRCSTATSRRNS